MRERGFDQKKNDSTKLKVNQQQSKKDNRIGNSHNLFHNIQKESYLPIYN